MFSKLRQSRLSRIACRGLQFGGNTKIDRALSCVYAYMPGDVKYPTRGKCVACRGLHILEKNNSEITTLVITLKMAVCKHNT